MQCEVLCVGRRDSAQSCSGPACFNFLFLFNFTLNYRSYRARVGKRQTVHTSTEAERCAKLHRTFRMCFKTAFKGAVWRSFFLISTVMTLIYLLHLFLRAPWLLMNMSAVVYFESKFIHRSAARNTLWCTEYTWLKIVPHKRTVYSCLGNVC